MSDKKEGNENEEYKQFSLSVPMSKVEGKRINYDCQDCEDGEYEIEEDGRAVALVGDRFYHGHFFPASELKKAYHKWENTLHDINHQGTTDARGMMLSSNILYFVGYNKNVSYDEDSKKMSMDIVINDNTLYASAWRGYVDLCEKAGQTPNVSISFKAKTGMMRASDLPEGIDYKQYGYSEDDMIPYFYDVRPDALSTVFKGACSDTDGCGIGKQCSESDGEDSENEELEKQKEEIIKWLKANEKEE